MSSTPAGWYPDPADRAPGAPPTQRWWDGSHWTEHVQPVQASQPSQPAGYAPRPTSAAYAAKPPALTPDGQPLAGWWHRAGAAVLDGLVLVPLSLLVAWPFIQDLVAAYRDFIEESMRAAQAGDPRPSPMALAEQQFGPLARLTLVSLAVNLAYTVTFLRLFSATPGKLLTGLRIRLRDTPGPLSWGTILKRWIAQNVATFFSFVPFLSTVASLYPLLDVLWPLWDDKKQALHDKFAATNVVRKVR